MNAVNIGKYQRLPSSRLASSMFPGTPCTNVLKFGDLNIETLNITLLWEGCGRRKSFQIIKYNKLLENLFTKKL